MKHYLNLTSSVLTLNSPCKNHGSVNSLHLYAGTWDAEPQKTMVALTVYACEEELGMLNLKSTFSNSKEKHTILWATMKQMCSTTA